MKCSIRKKKRVFKVDSHFCQYFVDRRVDDEKKTLRYIIKNKIQCVIMNKAIESIAIIS